MPPASPAVDKDYKEYLGGAFHALSFKSRVESYREQDGRTDGKRAQRRWFLRLLRALVGTGLVAIMKNGEGPLISVRADMDGLPVEEKSWFVIRKPS